MSLSVGRFREFGQSSEGLPPCSWVLDDDSCDTMIALQSACDRPKGLKRKRPNSDAVSRKGFSSSAMDNDSGLILDLGSIASPSDSGGSTGSRTSSASMFAKGTDEEGSPMELGLGLTGPSPPGFMNGNMTTVISGKSALSSLDLDGTYVNVKQNPGIGTNVLLELGRLQCNPLRENKIDGRKRKGFGATNYNSVDNELGMQLRLGLSENSPVIPESDCEISDMAFGCSGRGGTHQEIRSDNICGEHIPVVDEGSTSARSIKAGGYIPSLLMGRRLDNVVAHFEVQRVEISNQATNQNLERSFAAGDDVSEADISVNVRASIGTLSTGEASGGPADRAPKTCKFRGCGKGARGASGLCIAHGGGRRCQKHGCNKGAEGSTVYCKAHGGGRRCQNLGCTKSAEGKTDYCIGHGGGRRCSQDGCSKAARGRSGLCIRHGGGKRCQREGCTKSAEGYSGLCISHGGGRRCQYPECGKGAQGSTRFCKAHGGGKRCMIQGCNKGAEGSTPLCKGHGGGKRCMYDGGGICTKSVHGGTSYCVAHGGGKRCAVQGCTKSARGRTDYCVRHGGGKRCKFENCDKSAQGSTDFCKAHGGGKRCSWGQEGSQYSGELLRDKMGDLLKGPCDKFARGKIGLCAAHSALVLDRRVHGAGVIGNALPAGIGPGLFHGLVSMHKEQNCQSMKRTANGSDDNEDQGSDCGPSVSLMQACTNCEESVSMEDPVCQARGGMPQILLQPTSSNMHSSDVENQHFIKINEGVLPSNYYKTSNFWPGFTNKHVMAGKLYLPESGYLQGASETSGLRKQISEECSVFHRPLIPPQVLVPLSMQKRDSLASHRKERSEHPGSSNAGGDDIFNMSSLSLPDERVHGVNMYNMSSLPVPGGRVHGGSILTLLSKEAVNRGSAVEGDLQ